MQPISRAAAYDLDPGVSLRLQLENGFCLLIWSQQFDPFCASRCN